LLIAGSAEVVVYIFELGSRVRTPVRKLSLYYLRLTKKSNGLKKEFGIKGLKEIRSKSTNKYWNEISKKNINKYKDNSDIKEEDSLEILNTNDNEEIEELIKEAENNQISLIENIKNLK